MRTILLWTLALILTLSTPGVGTCGPLLNEIMADPASDWDGDQAYSYRNDEWIEIVNPGPADLSLDGFFLADETGAFVFGFTGSLPAFGHRVVYGSESVAWETENGESATGLRLGNDGDTATLWQVLDGDTLLVDAYTYATYEAEDDRSTGRYPDGTENWVIFDALNPYSGNGPPLGSGLPPTPGVANGEEPVARKEVSWGRVKTLFARP